MKFTILAVLIASLVVYGCGASHFAAETMMSCDFSTGAPKACTYKSNKEQTGIDATYEGWENGNTKKVTIKVDKSGTQESIVAGMVENNRQIGTILEKLLPLIEKGAMMGGS